MNLSGKIEVWGASVFNGASSVSRAVYWPGGPGKIVLGAFSGDGAIDFLSVSSQTGDWSYDVGDAFSAPTVADFIAPESILIFGVTLGGGESMSIPSGFVLVPCQ